MKLSTTLVAVVICTLILTGCTSTNAPATTESTEFTGSTTAPVQISESADRTVQVLEFSSDQMMYDGPGKGETPTDSVATTITINTGKIITSITNTYVAGYPKSAQYQSAFEKVIATEIMGKSIDDVQIGVLGGASNTSKAFNKALENIRTQING